MRCAQENLYHRKLTNCHYCNELIMTTLNDVLTWLSTTRAPVTVRERARLLILDCLGCMIAGSRAPEVKRLATLQARLDPGTIVLPGSTEAVSMSAAAFRFALATCRDEACEGLARAHGRPGVATIAAIWSLGTQMGASREKMVDALIVGYEVGSRLGEVMRIKKGMHVDGTFTCLGAAAAAAHMLDLGPQGIHAAVQISAIQMPSTLYLPIREGADSRNTYLAHAASLGLQSAISASAGLIAPTDGVSEAYQITLGHDHPLPSLPAIDHWHLMDGYFKPWAAVRHVHYGAAAGLQLRQALTGTDQLDAVRLFIYEEAVVYCANRAPRTTIQAQFSLTWGLAAMLVLGDLGPEAFSPEALANQKIRDLESMITVVADPALGVNGMRSAKLEVDVAFQTHRSFVDRVLGDPDMPMSRDDVIAKFLRYARPSLGEKLANEWVHQILQAS